MFEHFFHIQVMIRITCTVITVFSLWILCSLGIFLLFPAKFSLYFLAFMHFTAHFSLESKIIVFLVYFFCYGLFLIENASFQAPSTPLLKAPWGNNHSTVLFFYFFSISFFRNIPFCFFCLLCSLTLNIFLNLQSIEMLPNVSKVVAKMRSHYAIKYHRIFVIR